MSTNQTVLAAGASLLHFRLINRLGDDRSSVWSAEDTRTGRQVAIKILAKRMPSDKARRDQVLRDVRQIAAIAHPFLPSILEVNVDGDFLFMVMELIEGETLTRFLRGKGVARQNFFGFAFFIGEALNYLHNRGMVHLNVTGDSILVTPDHRVKLVGLNLENLTPRKEGAATTPRIEDPRFVSYMPPEYIAGRPVDARSDLFSLGIVLYEALTGRVPFVGTTASEIAQKILRDQPASPHSLNPAAEPAAIALLGRCIFKDPAKRYASAKAFVDDVRKSDPTVAKLPMTAPSPSPSLAPPPSVPAPAPAIAAEPALAAATPTVETPLAESTIPAAPKVALTDMALVVADLPGYETIRQSDPARADRLAGKLQQILGEAIYLFDGRVPDPFGPRIVGELPGAKGAIDAARKALIDIEDFNVSSHREAIDARIVVHYGAAGESGSRVVGPALEIANEALASLPSLRLHVSESALKQAQMKPAGPAVGRVKGVGFFQPEASPEAVEVLDAEAAIPDADGREGADGEAVASGPARTKFPLSVIAAAAIVVIVVVVGLVSAVMWKKGRASNLNAPARVATGQSRQRQMPQVRTVAIDPFTVESADPQSAVLGAKLRLATIEVLRSQPQILIGDDKSPGVIRFGAQIRDATAGLEFVPISGSQPGQPAAISTIADTSSRYVTWILDQLKLPPDKFVMPAAAVFEQFATAVAEYYAPGGADSPIPVSLMQSVIKADENFLPAQRFALKLFAEKGDEEAALAAGNKVLELDPNNIEVLRQVARWNARNGDPVAALTRFRTILGRDPMDGEALEAVGLYALGVGDEARFRKVLGRIGKQPPGTSMLHEPDFTFYSGHMDRAVLQYYDVETQDPNNPVLNLKIGRIAVLRHSMQMAQVELEKLQKLDPSYGYHLLKAYMLAEQRDTAGATAELKIAQGAARWSDQPFTASAEVYAIANDAHGVVESLKTAADRGEPTGFYILNNPIFRYLENDAQFAQVRVELQSDIEQLKGVMGTLGL